MNEQYVLNYVNPKERKRLHNELDTTEEIHQPYCDIRIRPVTIEYPCLTDVNFVERTGVRNMYFSEKRNDAASELEKDDEDAE